MVKVIKLKLRDVYTAQFLLMIESTFVVAGSSLHSYVCGMRACVVIPILRNYESHGYVRGYCAMVKVIKLKLRDVYTAQFLLMIESTFRSMYQTIQGSDRDVMNTGDYNQKLF